MDIAFILEYLRPGEEWKMVDNDYDNLEWLSDTEKPTLNEIQKAEPKALAARQAKLDAAQAKRDVALAKLAALGLEADDLKALGL